MTERKEMTVAEWVRRTPKCFEKEIAEFIIERINTLRNELYELTQLLTTMPELEAQLMAVEFRVCEVCAAGGDREHKACKARKDSYAKDVWCCDTCYAAWEARHA